MRATSNAGYHEFTVAETAKQDERIPLVIGRTIAWILLLAAIAAAGYEAYSALGAGGWRPIALGELWFKLHSSSLNGAQAGIQRYIAPWLWEPVITTVLLWPGWVVFGVPGAALLWLCRARPGAPRGHRR